jgi:sugar lactone lactonase YvrE
LISIDCIWPAEAELGEAPIWCPEEEALYWVDITGKAVHRLDPKSGERDSVPQAHQVGCIVKRQGGGFIAGFDCGLGFLDDALAGLEIFAAPETDLPRNRFNDGKCDRRGRFWVNSADKEEQDPNGSLYRVGRDRTVERLLSGIVLPNGMGWSPDDGTLYFTDSCRHIIEAFDFDAAIGTIANRRVFAAVDEAHGLPDGLCVDAAGFVWSAHWSGGRVTRYAPDGAIDRVIELPVPNVTSLAFGGAGLDRLFVTTARLGLSDEVLEAAPLSGGLFVLDVGVAGLPETRFAG